MKKNCVIYYRVSSKEQSDTGFSLDSQRRLLLDYAAGLGLEVLEEFRDVETAKQAGRPSFEAMASYLRSARSCNTILVEKTDRLYRNFEDAVKLSGLGVDIHFVKEGKVYNKDTRSSEKLSHDLKLVIAKNYIDNLSEETKKGQREKAKQGLWPTVAPLGYLNDRDTGMIVPDPERGHLVAKLFEAYATGQHSTGSLVSLAWDMGLRTKKGNKVGKSCIARTLQMPIYMGEYDWNGTRYQGKHEPLVSRALFEQVQKQRTAATHCAPSRRDHAFKGMIRCGNCDCLVTAETKLGRYTYYHCTHGRGNCAEKPVTEAALAEMLGAPLKDLRLSQERAEWIVEMIQTEDQDASQQRDRERRRLEQNRRDLEAKLDLIYEDKLSGTISPEFWKRKQAEYSAQLRWIGSELERLEREDGSDLATVERILEITQKAYSLYLARNPFEQRELLDRLLSKSVLTDRTVEVELAHPFDIIADGAAEDREKIEAGEPILAQNENWLLG